MKRKAIIKTVYIVQCSDVWYTRPKSLVTSSIYKTFFICHPFSFRHINFNCHSVQWRQDKYGGDGDGDATRSAKPFIQIVSHLFHLVNITSSSCVFFFSCFKVQVEKQIVKNVKVCWISENFYKCYARRSPKQKIGRHNLDFPLLHAAITHIFSIVTN